jgi:hypothetical protein
MSDIVSKILVECARAVDAVVKISRVSSTDKEFSFQNWFGERLKALSLNFDEPSRNAYPDFRLVDYPLGFETKGLGFPGRDANYDCNSQIPTGCHNGRQIYYVFGRYPANTMKEREYPVYDLVICHGNFLNADTGYVHKNKNLKGFGSYGDLIIRDRKMYIAPTPYALTNGIERQVSLIAPEGFQPAASLSLKGKMTRTETDNLIQGYTFNLKTHALTPVCAPNPNAGQRHVFSVYQAGSSSGSEVSLRQK